MGLVAATNLRTEVARGRFRGDLYVRLNVIPMRTTPLRERPADISPLTQHFLALHSAEVGRQISLSREAEQALVSYGWAGNVRELEDAIERAVVLSGADILTPEVFMLDDNSAEAGETAETGAVSSAIATVAPTGDSLQDCLDRAAVLRIKMALETANGSRAEAAVSLGIDRTTLYRLMKRLSL